MANSMETIKAAIRKIEIPRAARVQWLPRLDQILHTLNSNIFSSPFAVSIPKLKNMVPAGKKLGTENFEQLFRNAQRYKLGNQTEKMLADKGSDLRKRAKSILTKYATTSEGGYCARSDLGPSRQSDFVYRVAPWLLHYGGR